MARRPWLGAVVVALAFPLAPALATHPGSSHIYEIVGFSPDGAHVYFKKTSGYLMEQSEWLAVYDVATGKRRASEPVWRDCGGPDEECDRGRPISRAAGERSAARLYARYGAPTSGTRLAARAPVDPRAAIRDAKQGGHVQVFEGDGVELRATSRLRGKLVDPMQHDDPAASFEVTLALTAGGVTWTGTRRVRVPAIEDLDNGNILLWPELYVQEVVVAPDRRAAAIVFGRLPFVVGLSRPRATGP